MIKILFIGMSPKIGGINSFMMNVFSRLEGSKFHFEFINAYNKPLLFSRYIKQHNGSIRNVFIPRKGIKRYLLRYHIVKKFFKHHHNYDIVHLNTPSVNLSYWLKAAEKYGVRHLIVHSHSCGSDHNIIFNCLAKILKKYNQFYINNNKIIKLAASTSCGKYAFGKENSFIVINNGIESDLYKYNKWIDERLRRKLSLVGKKVILTTARLEYQKNYPKIIRVFYYIHKIKHNTTLIIIGDGSLKDKIKYMVDYYGLTNCVYFLGECSGNTVRRFLNIANLMIMPSFYEAVPFSLTEAQASGVPALVSKEGIPDEADITNKIYYLSLTVSDYKWAINAVNILNKKLSVEDRLIMNKKVRLSNFNTDKSVSKLERIYIACLRNN